MKTSVEILTLISPPPGAYLTLSLEPTFGLALSLKSALIVSIFLSPPPGLWLAFSRDPILDLAFHCNFVETIYNNYYTSKLNNN